MTPKGVLDMKPDPPLRGDITSEVGLLLLLWEDDVATIGKCDTLREQVQQAVPWPSLRRTRREGLGQAWEIRLDVRDAAFDFGSLLSSEAVEHKRVFNGLFVIL